MIFCNRFTAVILLGLFGFLATNNVRAQLQDPYHQGLKLVEEGDVENGLSVWLDEYNRSIEDEYAEPDPRIGISFIETVTARSLTRYYPIASKIYFWGISGEKVTPFKDLLQAELRRLEPLMTSDEVNSMRRALRRENPEFFKILTHFWLKLDHRPATTVNERLLEHWERIATARESFTVSRASVYDTDDRGTIYVKYGEPDRVAKNIGNFDTNIEVAGITDPSNRFVPDTRVTSDATVEVWFYDSLTPDIDDDVLFLFGPDADTGGFQQLRSPEDLVSTVGLRGLAKGSFSDPEAQTVRNLYERLSHLDPYFEELFIDLESQLRLSESGEQYFNSEHTPRSNMMRVRNDLFSRQQQAPKSVPMTRRTTFDLNLSTKQYRFLDQENRPYTALIAFTDPVEALNFHMARSGNFQTFENLVTTTVLSGYSNDGTITDRQIDRITIDLSEGINIPLQSYFTVRTEESRQYRLTAEITDTLLMSRSENHYTDSKGVLGQGNRDFELENSLFGNNEDLMMSDLVVGYLAEEQELNEELMFPFFITPDDHFYPGSRLFVKFELYNLTENEEGLYRYEADFKIERNRSFIRNLFTSDAEVSLGLDSTTDRPRDSRVLEFDSENLEPGEYNLIIELTDLVSRDQLSRSVRFVIDDSEERYLTESDLNP